MKHTKPTSKVFHICLSTIFTLFLSLVSLSSYAANPLGFEIGKATYDDVQASLSNMLTLDHAGINKYSGGKMLVADNPEILGYNGLDKVTLVFDNKNILTAVMMRLERNDKGRRDAGFMYVYKRLNEKYLPVFRNLKPMGRMTAGFTTTDHNVKINMIAQQSSNMFDLQYLSKKFWKRYETVKAEQEKKVEKSVQYSGLIPVSNTF